MPSGNCKLNTFIYKTHNKYTVSWKATKSLLANELLLRELLKTIRYMKGVLLDIGCGDKPYREILSSHVDSYIGIDLPQTLYKKHVIDTFADAHCLPFKKNNFDTVLCLEVLEHVERPLEVVKEIYEVLKKGGVLILSAPQNYCIHKDPKDYYRFTKDGLEEIVKQANFKVCYINSLGGTREFFWDFISKLLIIKLEGGIFRKIVPGIFKKVIPAIPQIIFLKIFKNSDVNSLFSLGNILVATK